MPEDLPLYVFIDESGNFDFSPKGPRHYSITAVITHAPWEFVDQVSRLYFEILAEETILGLEENYLEEKLCHRFHASEDKQVVRDAFFSLIQQMGGFKAHSIVARKYRANPTIQEPKRFYPMITGKLLDYIFKSYAYSKLVIFLDSTPVTKDQKAFKGAIKSEIKSKGPKRPFKIYYPNSSSCAFLQVSDYINWAIFRKWENRDPRSYELIKNFLGKPELDIFEFGDIDYY